MNLLEVLFNAVYQLAEGNPPAQRMIVGAAQAYNDRMAEINRQPSVPALRTVSCRKRQRED